MAVINVLDKHTAELIAAGEVVERPASVVKELCENAIDAGALSVCVSIDNGGIDRIEIRDDGCGIEPEYMHNAFVSHATSKISNEDDLTHIATLGFRGEALASIAAVARVSLISKTQENENAYEYTIQGGEEQSLCEAARGQGTTIIVRDLFYNTPARMKFLKKNATEAGYVSDVVSRLALSHPEVSFKFIKDGKEQFFTPGDGELLSAVRAVLSRDFAKDLINVNYTENDITVSGLITPPRAARASRSMQYFYINGRFVKNTTAIAALENAYKGILMGGRFPGCVLNIQMPCDKVDVNVHPAKTEVKFVRESEVFSAVYRAAKSVLFTAESMQKNFDFSQNSAISAKAQRDQQTYGKSFVSAGMGKTQYAEKSESFEKTPALAGNTAGNTPYGGNINGVAYSVPKTESLNGAADLSSAYLPKNDGYLASSPMGMYETANSKNSYTVKKVPDIFVEDKPETEKTNGENEYISAEQTEQAFVQPSFENYEKESNFPDSADALPEGQEKEPALEYIGEIFKTYILAQRGNEFCFIDKHAAHERIIYEKIKQSYGGVAAQQLLCPENVILSAEEKNAVIQNAEYLSNFGIDIEDFGGNSVLVRAVPADIADCEPSLLITELANKLLQNQKNPLSEKTEWVLHSISCRAAVKAGDKSTAQELIYLAEKILNGEVPAFCPHGRPVVLKLTKKELEKQFGRLG